MRLAPAWRWTRRGLLLLGLWLLHRVLRGAGRRPPQRLSGRAVRDALRRQGAVVDGLYIDGTGETPRALSLSCPHLGCRVHRVATGFACPCHRSRFDVHGRWLSGPAKRGLRRIALHAAGDDWLAGGEPHG